MSLSAARIKARALEAGFDLCGVAAADAFPELLSLHDWLTRGYAGEMRYMVRTAKVRADVRSLLPSAASVIVCASVYNVDRPYSTARGDSREARISRYAWGDDYHLLMRKRLGELLAWMRAESPAPLDARAFVDTGPVQERVYAQHAGLGWIGKNTCLINPQLGSWLFLSEIICSLTLEPDQPGFDQCGTCTLCLEACPTGALVEPRVLDATRCLSYLTIELRGAVPEAQREAIGAHVYGCDICQDVCPWNQVAAESPGPEWQPRPWLDSPRLVDLWRTSDAAFTEGLRRSAMKRAKLTGLRRNVALAIGNSGDGEATAALDEPDEVSPSKRDVMVAEHVAWAKRRIGQRDG